jgi:hypothetical protein
MSDDVILVCISDQNSGTPSRITASSYVLSAVSPVFKTMLGPNFREGTTLAAFGSVELDLEDDDSQMMTLICGFSTTDAMPESQTYSTKDPK